MTMYTNSPLITYQHLTLSRQPDRVYDVTRITPHCYVGAVTAKQGCDYFYSNGRSDSPSSNYVIGYDGSIGLSVDEKDRAYSTTSYDNDNRAINIEIASSSMSPYNISGAAYQSTVKLMADICKRYGKKKLVYIKVKEAALSYDQPDDEMLITLHKWFCATACPGAYIISRLPDIVRDVNALLSENNGATKNGEKVAKKYYTQSGYYKKKSSAETLAVKLKEAGFSAAVKDDGGAYRVVSGGYYATKAEAEQRRTALRAAGFAVIIKEVE